MRRKASISLLTFSLLSLISTGYSDATIDNANHIFNAVHSSMRQWGSSLNHNGMSFFLATVPEGTQLYHGTSDPDFIKGMQWLAFEPEHALIFAHPRRPPPIEGEKLHSDRKGSGKSAVPHNRAGWGQKESSPEHNYVKEMASNHRQHNDKPHPLPPLRNGHDTPPPPYEQGPRRHREFPPPPPLPPGHVYKPYPPPPRKPRPNRGPKHPWDPTHHRPPPPGLPSESLELRSTSSGLREPQSQEPLRVNPPPSSPPSEHTGYLHTYVTRHALRLLYIDGLSAGKTENGTLDTQDRLLLNLTDEQMGRPFGGEMLRARGLCELAAGLWEGRVDGILRMEGGFEVILCEFEQHLERVDVVHVEEGGIGRPGRGVMGGWQYIKAITSRYHGLGGDRVHIDYDRFVSVFAHYAPGLWDNDVHSDTRMPRLTNVPPSTLSTIKSEVTHMILNAHRASPPSHPRNWQTITDTVVARYSTPLHHITTSPLLRSDPDALAAYLSTLLHPFIDARARNAPLETARCIAQLLPPLTSTTSSATSDDPPLAHLALHTVTSRICDTLLTALSISSAPTPHVSYRAVYAARAVDGVQELVDWLAWTSWKECATCADEEVCFVPIWPMGASEDHARPRCRGEEGVAQQRGYWGRMGPPGARDGEKEGEGERV